MDRVHPLPQMEAKSLRGIVEDRPVTLITSAPAWRALNGALNISVVQRFEPDDASEDSFAAIASSLSDEARVVYGVGGGLAVDAAKYVAHARRLPLVGIPTALSVDAFLTPASGMRRDGCVTYLETGPPQTLFVDWDVIAAAPSGVRAAGVCDLLSIATALWDWRFAESEGRLSQGEAYSPVMAGLVEEILDEAILLCPRLGRGEPAALERLLTLLGLEVQICNFAGHSRTEEGSEHYFAYSAENIVGSGFTHAELVSPGIIAMASAQGQDAVRLGGALESAGLNLDGIARVVGEHVLNELPVYVKRHNLPFGVANVLDETRISAALQAAWR